MQSGEEKMSTEKKRQKEKDSEEVIDTDVSFNDSAKKRRIDRTVFKSK
jgi:hypothetical protein